MARVNLGHRDTTIQLALPLRRPFVEQLAHREGEWVDHIAWDASSRRIRAEKRLMLGDLVLRTEPQPAPPADQCRKLLMAQLKDAEWQDLVPWPERCEQLRRRLALAHQHLGAPWPARDRNTLQRDTEQWLGPCLEGCLSWDDVKADALEQALWGDLDWNLRRELNRLLPATLTIPSGREATLRYDEDEVVLAVKLQEMFGCEAGPTVLHNRLPVIVELLSPAGRPLQRTRDLAGFWRGSYQDVRRDMRGRYPKHPWPENPLEATATALTNRRLGTSP